MTDEVFCNRCGYLLDSPLESSQGDRVPCKRCGSTSRLYSAHIAASIVLRGGLGLKARRRGQKKPFHESYRGPDFSHSRQKHVDKKRIIDRENDIYLEHVQDYETGEIIHHKDEPLSQHKGHGSAKVGASNKRM